MRELLQRYILVNGQPVTADHLTWGRWMTEHPEDKIIRKTQIDDMVISTVFLGLDHNFSPKEEETEPILFKTMIFGGEHDGEQWRFATHAEAVEFHEVFCASLSAARRFFP